MASWVLVPCLVSLRTEFNKLAPSRDKASDGSIGDTSHAASSSDHNPDETGNTPYEDADSKNEVHAIDVDTNLRKSGWTMQRAVNIIVAKHKSGADNRLQYVIYNRKIYSRSWGWTARDYTGASPHTEHAHFSARYTTAQENDTSPWGLLEAEEDEMPSAAEVAAEVMRQMKAQFPGMLLNAKIGDKAYPSRTVGTHLRDLQVMRDYMTGDGKGANQNPPRKGSYLNIVSGVPGTLSQHGQVLAAIAQAVQNSENNAEVKAALDALAQSPEQSAQTVLAGITMSRSDEEAAAMLRDLYGPERAASIGNLLATGDTATESA
ncbi:hypothetical protein [Symbioplanes lichenis]|uniref:hypothetical protein n=1 Tax=Symbioplanes lichenis TaxID=1629072 RepID=UPI002739424D|nr:hypothetical protein [Actinoplanes lichenis]